MTRARIFIGLAFVYTFGLIGIAMTLPKGHWLNTTQLYGIIGIYPAGMFAPAALPAFLLLAAAICSEEQG